MFSISIGQCPVFLSEKISSFQNSFASPGILPIYIDVRFF
jgi:hypothetical protein